MPNDDEAFQSFLDHRIPRDLQPLYADRVSAYRAAWRAAIQYRDDIENTRDDETAALLKKQ